MRRLFYILLALLGFGALALAAQTTPNSMPGCVYNASGITLANGQSSVIQCDSSGKIMVH